MLLSVFEIKIPRISAKYVKLYVASNPGTDIYVTELEAYNEVRSEGSEVTTTSKYTSYRTDFNMRWRPLSDISVYYSFFGAHSVPEPGPDSTDLSYSASISWTPSRYFNPVFSISEARDKTEGEPEDLGRSYSLSIASSPLDTLDVSFGLMRSERYEGGKKESRSDSYSLYISALLFPDLSASLDLTRNTSKNYREGDTAKSFSGRLSTTARLTPKFTLDATYYYSKSEAEDSTTTRRFDLTASWRASDVLFLRTTHNWNWKEGSNTYSSTYTMGLSPTPKVQLNVQYAYNKDQDETVKTYSSFVSWAISRYISLKSNYSCQERGGEKSWYLSIQLTARF